jgi:hypothetical protein
VLAIKVTMISFLLVRRPLPDRISLSSVTLGYLYERHYQHEASARPGLPYIYVTTAPQQDHCASITRSASFAIMRPPTDKTPASSGPADLTSRTLPVTILTPRNPEGKRLFSDHFERNTLLQVSPENREEYIQMLLKVKTKFAVLRRTD